MCICDDCVQPCNQLIEEEAPLPRASLSIRAWTGCDRPVAWTESHHVRHWADHGETRVDHLVLLCRVHHRRGHEQGWTLEWTSSGAPVAVPP